MSHIDIDRAAPWFGPSTSFQDVVDEPTNRFLRVSTPDFRRIARTPDCDVDEIEEFGVTRRWRAEE